MSSISARKPALRMALSFPCVPSMVAFQRALLLLSALTVVLFATIHPASAVSAAIVRVTAPIEIDGNDDDWTAVTAEQTIRGRFDTAATFKLAYDSTSVYALVKVKDQTPLANSATVYQELLKGGAAIGLCFGPSVTGGAYQRIMLAHTKLGDRIIVMRPTWPGQPHPYTYFTPAGGTVRMDDVHRIDADGAQVAFKSTTSGYVAEVKIPIALLGYKPAARLRIPFDAQIIFSDPAGTTNVDTAWWASSGAGPDCTTDMATEARLYPDLWGTAEFYATDPGPAPATAATVTTDPAFTPRGSPITFTLPRRCRVSAIIVDNKGWVVRELLRAAPMDPGKQTIWWDGRDRWGAIEPPGQYHYKVAYFDGIKATFAASAGNSAKPPYRTTDGLGSIGGQHGGPCVVCADSTGVYMGNCGEEGQAAMRKMDCATQKSLWFHSVGTFGMAVGLAVDDSSAYMIVAANNECRLLKMDKATGLNQPIGPMRDPISLGNVSPVGMAILGGKAYYTLPATNEIRSIDLTTGSPGAPISIPAPQGLCAKSNSLLVCTGSTVVALDPATGKQTVQIADLVSPAGIAVDQSGRIFVSETGASQQIRRFSADGHLEITFGVPGGRKYPANPYNPNAFENITGLAIGPDGHLWAVEHLVEAPRRYIELTADGAWIRDIFGPSRCGATVGFDEDDPSSIYYRSANGSFFTNSHVDYASYAESPDPSKGFQIKAIWNMTQNGSDSTATPDLVKESSQTGYSRVLVFTGPSGKRYFWATSGASTAIWLWENNRWIPAATVGNHDGKSPNQYWTDKNADGLVEPEECSAQIPPTSSWNWIGRDLTLFGLDGTLKPASIDARGVPDYLGGKFTPYVAAGVPSLYSYFDEGAYSPEVCPGEDGATYFSENNGPHQNRDFWDRCSENRIIKVENGKAVWMVGHHDGSMKHDGDSIVLFGISGEVDGVVVASDVGSQFVAYTNDGIPLGWLLKDESGRTPDVGPTSIYVENAAPNEFIEDTSTGRRLLISHTTEDVRVFDITGAFGTDLTRLEGTLNLTSSLPRSSAVGQSGVTTLPYSTWESSIYEGWRATNIDAYDYEWADDSASLNIRKNGAITAEVRLRRDAGRLCIYADVLDPNAFTGSQTLSAPAFGASPGIELDLGPANPISRKTAGPGDTRIFLSAKQDPKNGLTGVVLACKPASAPIPASPELSAQDSVAEYRDRGTSAPTDLSHGLSAIPGAQIAVRKRFDGQGYAMEAEIPIAAFPEIATVQPVSFHHGSHHGDDGDRKTESREDLVLPLHINAAVWQTAPAGKPVRTAWTIDGFTGADALSLNPGNWGIASVPPTVKLTAGSGATTETDLRYETTESSVFTWSNAPKVIVKSCLYGGRWAITASGSAFVTSPPRDGFSLICPPVGGASRWADRTVSLDMSACGFPFVGADSEQATNANPVKATLQYRFAPGQSGKLHVLWGSYTDNSASGAALSVVGADGISYDSTKIPDLAFNGPYNGAFQARESTFMVSGTNTVTIALSSRGGSPAYLSAVWIEPIDITTFTSGSPIVLAAYPGAGSADLRRVEFRINGAPVGSASAPPYTCTWTPQSPGFYDATASVTDQLGVTAVSESVGLKVAHK